MFESLLQTSYFALFLIISLGCTVTRVRRSGIDLIAEPNLSHCRRNDQHTRTGGSRFDGRQLGSQHCLRYSLSHCHGLPDLVHQVHCRGYLKEQKELLTKYKI